MPGSSPLGPAEPAIDLSPTPGDEVKTTTCYMCACRCGIKVWLQDGQIRYIQGNPDHPVNRGVLCAKGSAGIMQHYSPARLDKPLLRVGERGSGEFREIEWDEALEIATAWLAPIRERNPDELAFFTGRDQSQALTGWWAQQFGTVNYAAHGGFCSVNMAAGGLYTLGGSFWEFGEPDWEHTRYLMLWGVAEDHDSNPIKLGLGKVKANGAKIVAVNPVRSGYGAIADEWIGIRPGTDGLFAFALIHELLKADRIDLDYLVRHANAHWLVIANPGGADDGLFARDGEGRPLCWDRGGDCAVAAGATGISPAVVGEYVLADDRRAHPVFHLLAERYLDPQYSPDAVAGRCGVPAATIRRIARELADAAFEQEIRIPVAWTDAWGREHAEMVGRPVSMHAMRGISAHSNGFHTCRALHLLQMLLGAVDTPGSFRYQPPFPKPIAPPNRPGRSRGPDGVLDAAPLGFVHGPEDLVTDADGQPRRIDHAYSWAYPLSAHGMMHTVIRNAWAGDPYRIDTLLMFMANMGWNSAMNTAETIGWLTDRNDDGEYRIPRIIYSDAYASEMVAYADLVLPDTTYLERFDAISLLDRPISDADGASDAIRHPVLDPAKQRAGRDVRGFQSVLIELGARLGLPGLVHEDGSPRYRDYADYITHHERAPGVGLLAGWRGDHGELDAKGPPNPEQLQRYIDNGGFWRSEIPEHARYYKMANRGYLDWARHMGFLGHDEPIVLQLYSETMQKFRLAAQGHGAARPPEAHRERVATYFDPLPIWYEPFEGAQAADANIRFPLSAVTQRPMFMYHAWGSQNAWLRQITTRNYLYLHPDTGARHGIDDEDWITVTSHHGEITVQAKFAGNVQPDTVWTWNAIGKRRGAWRLDKDAPEGRKGFLLNHLISDITPNGDYANADPVTGQAAWFDLRVRIAPAAPQSETAPQFEPLRMGRADEAPLRYGAGFRARRAGHEEESA
ncbi:molybdopterin oxidoreductase family protein [Marilutibacter chinensis]|uniref:Molybdopterin oxidoreductase family protein n=1 Tax=Marilutibacter chinensis TaxID=2912247 RepID=A0ABS9HTW7_9GAMM|nr:molybdopterin oxidoreductase family protein [Lysobacter chinensis]MCF7221527.1 molybdopterin oxidoreductase family protein [Lysobacter chinensis]